jgi:hypothetical protein
MKLCRKCNRSNEETEERCVACNASLEDAQAEPWVDPWDDWSGAWARRRANLRNELVYAAMVYVLAIDLSAFLISGCVWDFTLVRLALSAVLVAFGICQGVMGRFLGGFLQVTITAFLLSGGSLFNPLAFSTIGAHYLIVMLFCFWVSSLREL